jgi:hypothetical protein
MNGQHNAVLYEYGLFDDEDKYCKNQQQFKAILNSGFTTVILWTIHVNEKGDLYYNDNLIVQNGMFEKQYDYLPKLINNLKSGNLVKTVVLGLSSGGTSDFKHIKDMFASSTGKEILLNNFKVLVDELPIDGFDFDLEEFPLENYTDTIVQLTLELDKYVKIITYCPYCDEDFWLDCLVQVYAKNNSNQIVSWFNLQCYDGGSGNNPEVWAKKIISYPSPLGILDSEAFIVPGYWCLYQSPEEVQDIFRELKKTDQGINGGFIWNSSDIFKVKHDPKDYAQAILQGLDSVIRTRY